MELYLVRHPKPAIASGICYGQPDIDIVDDISELVRSLQQQLLSIQFTGFYSSPLLRCKKLALALAAGGDYPAIQYDNRLKELYFGDWEMRYWHEIPRKDIDYWASDYLHIPPGNGESYQDLRLRLLDFLQSLSTDYQHQAVLIITHAGVIKTLLAELKLMSIDQALQLEIAYGSVHKVDYVHPIGCSSYSVKS